MNAEVIAFAVLSLFPALLIFNNSWKETLYQFEIKHKFKLLFISLIGGISSFAIYLLLSYFLFNNLFLLKNSYVITLLENSSMIVSILILYYFFNSFFNDIISSIIIITGISLFERACILIDQNLLINTIEIIQRLIIYLLFFIYTAQIYIILFFSIAFHIHTKIHKNYLGILISLIIYFTFSLLFSTVITGDIILNFKDFKLIFLFISIIGIIILNYVYSYIKKYIIFNFGSYNPLNIIKFKALNRNLFLYCTKCDEPVKNKGYIYKSIEYGFCPKCNFLITNNFFHLIRLNSVEYTDINFYDDFIKDKERILYLNEQKSIIFNSKRQYISADIKDLNEYLRNLKKETQIEILENKYIFKFLKILGFKYYKKNEYKIL